MKSLYGKFLAMTAIIMVMSTVIAFLIVNTYYHQNMKEENSAKNISIVQQIATYIESEQPPNLEFFLRTEAAVGYKLVLVSPTEEIEFFGAPFREHNLAQEAIDQVLDGQVYNGMQNFPTETFMTGFFADESSNTVGSPVLYQGERYALFLRPDIKLLFTEVHLLLGGMVIVIAIISFLAMLFFAKKLIDPITELTKATKQIGDEKFVESLDIARQDEIGQLAQSFSQMVERLKQNDQMRKQFISDVSHDFQSPLLNIRGYASLLNKREVDEETRQQYASIIESETERLSTLTKQLLLLTSLDQLKTPLQKKTYALDEQIRDVVRNYQWQIVNKELSLELEVEPITYQGDPAFLEKVWDNLISNAVKYTEQGSIRISLKELSEEIVFCIEDSGIGIEEEHIPQLFERFYRADSSRTKEIEGTGLGLAIVQQVVELHSGTIDMKSELDKGTKITVYLSKKNEK